MKLAADRSMLLDCCKKFEKVVPNIIATSSEFHLLIAKDGLSEAVLPKYSYSYISIKQVLKNER